jgi:hypothetical protein
MTNINKNIPVNTYCIEFKPEVENHTIIGLSSQARKTSSLFFSLQWPVVPQKTFLSGRNDILSTSGSGWLALGVNNVENVKTE